MGEVRTVSLPSPACYRNSGMEYTKYRFCKLFEGHNIDVFQPDAVEVGGMTELVKIAAGDGVRYPCCASCQWPLQLPFRRLATERISGKLA